MYKYTRKQEQTILAKRLRSIFSSGHESTTFEMIPVYPKKTH